MKSWSCAACTFVNQKNTDQCEMCFTKRNDKVVAANTSTPRRQKRTHSRQEIERQRMKRQLEKEKKRLEVEVQRKSAKAKKEMIEKEARLREAAAQQEKRRIIEFNEEKRRLAAKQQAQKQKLAGTSQKHNLDDPNTFKEYLPASQRRKLQARRTQDREKRIRELKEKNLVKTGPSTQPSQVKKTDALNKNTNNPCLEQLAPPESALDELVYAQFAKKPYTPLYTANKKKQLPLVTLKKREEGKFLYGTRLIRVGANANNQVFVQQGSRQLDFLSFIKQYEKIEAMKL
eukprot:CAMPEP_0201552608 /NCGR_PEP_ID=MMETSP0173_2-20130828/16811_1 /ASSEMBLY_ACC=CAM_ASM_000268 /TAXON_ID=218659 /ORGANISM="Vexillifera sp., Strain DIVA3 564/2" /LENGTH=287 /DNA_ID=CAMNT_0047963111 /DNA_START=20 /DNA_END=880 /DNA_ORIENTATION=-